MPNWPQVGKKQAQSSYYYRHAGNTQMFDAFGKAPGAPAIRLAHLGDNRRGVPMRALVVDTVFQCAPGLASFGVTPKTNHQGRWMNVLHADGHVASRSNAERRFTDRSQVRRRLQKSLSLCMPLCAYLPASPK